MRISTLSAVAANILLAKMVMADLPSVTITKAPVAVQTALVSYISNWDHHTLGVNATVGAIISSVYMASSANPTAANAILSVRSHLNFNDGPTPLFKDLEAPSSVVASIASQLPTIAPFPQALDVVSSIYGYLGSVASAELNGQTTIPPAPSGWTLPPLSETGAGIPQTSSSAPAVATSASASASECPAKTFRSSTITPAASSASAVAAMASQSQATNGGMAVSAAQAFAFLGLALAMSLWRWT